MKNIIDILKGLGIEVPADKETELTKEVAENYKTVAEHDKKVQKMQTEIDTATKRAETAEDTLKGFEGKNFDEITADRDKWKTDYEALIQKQKEDAENAELEEAISTAIKNAKGKDAVSIRAHLDMDSIRSSKNRDKDIADAIKNLTESENTSFLFNTEAEDNSAQFTDISGKRTPQTDIHEAQLRSAFGLEPKKD